METLQVRRLSPVTIFKLIAVGTTFSIVPISVLMGVLALFGYSVMTWNHQPLTGLPGLIAAPMVGLFTSMVFTLLVGVLCIGGLWLFSRFWSMELRIERVP